MSGYGPSRSELVRRGETMNGLRDRQHTLNMRLLLAIQNHDAALQTELELRLEELLSQIRSLGSDLRRDQAKLMETPGQARDRDVPPAGDAPEQLPLG